MTQINHPDYYNWHPAAECKDIAQEFDYNLGAAIKYIWRAGRKPGEDYTTALRKAIASLEQEIERKAPAST